MTHDRRPMNAHRFAHAVLLAATAALLAGCADFPLFDKKPARSPSHPKATSTVERDTPAVREAPARPKEKPRDRDDAPTPNAGLQEGIRLYNDGDYNGAIRQDIPFNPNVKDGRRTVGLSVDKSNWANTLDQPPFMAFQVGCGITFTFGGLRVDGNAQVVDVDQRPIDGLFAAGELVGGVFYFNYPGGTGLMSGAVFGRIAGSAAVR